jgi:putative SOS response-associated peptidase YedK
MCGRVVQASGPDQLGLRIVNSFEGRDRRGGNVPPRYNAAPSQELFVIRQQPQTGERTLDLLKWGLVPYWCKAKPKPPPINAKAETVHKLPMFRDAYAKRRCILPIDAFFEWKAILGQKVKQPFAIGMRDRSPFGLAGLWENWKDPETGEWVRTFAVITTAANELVAEIHDRMPAILRAEDYDRWLGVEPGPRELLKPFPAEPMMMWPVSTRVNTPKNDDADLLVPQAEADAYAPPDGNSA